MATVTCLVIKILQNSFQNLHFEVNYLYNLHCFQGFQVTSNELAFSIKVSVLLDKLLHIYFKCHVVLRTSWGNNQMRSSKWSFLMFSVRKSDSFSVNRFILSSRSVYMSDYSSELVCAKRLSHCHKALECLIHLSELVHTKWFSLSKC